eukprot:m.656864 g.656864  ORF g.656864 m.656864 type:complete len:81 (+) comp22707_c1_seq9:2014-2256(+)
MTLWPCSTVPPNSGQLFLPLMLPLLDKISGIDGENSGCSARSTSIWADFPHNVVVFDMRVVLVFGDMSEVPCLKTPDTMR